jgi:molybdopterin-guanine dinucleotide biosynthesis protein A
MSPPTTSGYILAGGRSSRLGLDKRRIRIAETTILERTCNLVREVLGSEPVLVGDNISASMASGCRIVADACTGAGPLAGLVAALQDCRTEWALILAADLPFLQLDPLRTLIQNTGSGCQAVALTQFERLEPLAATYRCETLPFWRECLAAGRLSLHEGLWELIVGRIVVPAASRDLFNLNTPADLAEFNLVLRR